MLVPASGCDINNGRDTDGLGVPPDTDAVTAADVSTAWPATVNVTAAADCFSALTSADRRREERVAWLTGLDEAVGLADGNTCTGMGLTPAMDTAVTAPIDINQITCTDHHSIPRQLLKTVTSY
jgi:hypothetical protein